MIGLRKTLGMRGSATIQAASRSFAGGGSKPKNIDPKTTDFDIVFVGKQHFFTIYEDPRSHYSAFFICNDAAVIYSLERGQKLT
jgi:hypothetical protein